MQKRSHRRYCVAYGCSNSNKKIPDLSLFALPKDIERRQEWLTIIGREDLLKKEKLNYKSYEVCSAHFEDSAIKIIKNLKTDAVPTRSLCKKSDSASSATAEELESTDVDSRTKCNVRIKKRSTISIATQTEKSLEETTQINKQLSEKSSQKRDNSENFKESKRKRKCLEYEFNKIKKDLETKNTITSDTEDDSVNCQNKFKGNRYDAQYKVFALNLHYSSPKTYRCLQTALKLPSRSTLIRLTSKLKISPKLDDRVLESLSSKIKSLPEKAKYCSICADKMVLNRNLYYDIKTDEVIGFHNIDGKISQEIASHAYVIMLQGILFNWKQPIAYAFLASTKHYVELDEWINEAIRKLFGVGVEVKAVITNQGSNFDKYAEVVKNVTIENPYFFVDEHKVYYIYDVPNLLNCVRNNLLSSNFYYNGEFISWEYIKTLYDDQKQKNLRLIPKVSDAHIEPNDFQRTRLQYAAQIFSNTVYAALETYIDFGKMSEDARATATFIKTMDDLFDVLNSCKVNTVKKLQTAFRMSEDQKRVLEEAQNMFASLQSIDSTGEDVTNQTRTFRNFQISIQSIQQLFKDLKKEGFQYLFTRSLNQDCLENFFVSVRQQGGSCTEPAPILFTRAFSKLVLMNMLKNLPSANCESDIYQILLESEDVTKTNITSPAEKSISSLVLLDGETDYRMDLPEVNALTYVTSYLIFKCLKKHNCDEMKRELKSMLGLDLKDYKAYNKNCSFYGKLKMPPPKLIHYVDKLESAFTNNFEKCIQERLGSKFFELLNEIPPVKLCSCFPTDYFVKLFIRLRIFSTLKFNNRCFKNSNKSIEYLKVKQL